MLNFMTYLIQQHWIDEKELQAIIQTKISRDESLLCYLAQYQYIDSQRLAEAAAKIFHLPLLDLTQEKSDPLVFKLLPQNWLKEFHIFPLKSSATSIDIALADPSHLKAIESIQFYTHLSVNVRLARYDHIQQAIKQLLMDHNTQLLHQTNLASTQVNEAVYQLDMLNEGSDEPLIRFVNQILEQAIQKKISDIHFESGEKECRIRYRYQGLLMEGDQLPFSLSKRLMSRLKIMANLDISESRLPQDGRCQIRLAHNQCVDIRASSCPTIYGEKIVYRILNNDSKIRSLDEIDFNAEQKEIFIKAIKKPQGLILVTGPTGSGKTSTLYAALLALNTIEKNIVTVEDPIEIVLPGINQVQINAKAGVTFSRVLRAFLRQDPDILMIGEIRDQETAEIAVHAAETGHLVLSTLHTNNACEALIRLQHMKIHPYHVASSLILVTAQRLVRHLCPLCKKLMPLSPFFREQFKIRSETKVYQAVGCSQCQNGYNGRMAIHELLPLKSDFYDGMIKETSLAAIQALARKNNYVSLQSSSIQKMLEGETSADEICRVVGF